MMKVIASDNVTSIKGNEAKVPFNGRTFTCCIHSDLPGAVEAMTHVRTAVNQTASSSQ